MKKHTKITQIAKQIEIKYGRIMENKLTHIYKKSLGQNFISDKNLLSAIVSDAGVSQEDTVLEVGAGSGNLTTAIAEVANKVLVFEIDKSLEDFLLNKFSDYNNIKLIMQDITKTSDTEIQELTGGSFKVVANLPYYITTPIIFQFLECATPPTSITIMVQKEVAERIVAKPNTPDYGALTVMINYYGEPIITRQVNRKMFYPVPNVDSAVVRINLRSDIDREFSKHYSKVVGAAFHMRRKTLANNLSKAFGLSKTDISSIITSLGFDNNVRGERLSSLDFEKLTRSILAKQKTT